MPTDPPATVLAPHPGFPRWASQFVAGHVPSQAFSHLDRPAFEAALVQLLEVARLGGWVEGHEPGYAAGRQAERLALVADVTAPATPWPAGTPYPGEATLLTPPAGG